MLAYCILQYLLKLEKKINKILLVFRSSIVHASTHRTHNYVLTHMHASRTHTQQSVFRFVISSIR